MGLRDCVPRGNVSSQIFLSNIFIRKPILIFGGFFVFCFLFFTAKTNIFSRKCSESFGAVFIVSFLSKEMTHLWTTKMNVNLRLLIQETLDGKLMIFISRNEKKK